MFKSVLMSCFTITKQEGNKTIKPGFCKVPAALWEMGQMLRKDFDQLGRTVYEQEAKLNKQLHTAIKSKNP